MTKRKHSYSKEANGIHFLKQTLVLLLSFACVALFIVQIFALQFPALSLLFFCGYGFVTLELIKDTKHLDLFMHVHKAMHKSP